MPLLSTGPLRRFKAGEEKKPFLLPAWDQTTNFTTATKKQTQRFDVDHTYIFEINCLAFFLKFTSIWGIQSQPHVLAPDTILENGT
jgi:hypothetical protein